MSKILKHPFNRMKYIDTYNLLKNNINYTDDRIIVPGTIEIRNFTFVSNNRQLLSDDTPDDSFLGYDLRHETGMAYKMLDVCDIDVEENIKFRYHVFSPIGTEKAKDIVLMFHGLNEKHWHKYLPWAKYIVDTTGKTVVLFPLAFHMNRAPEAWSNARLMYEAGNRRKELFPDIVNSSLFNVAISTRIQTRPQRFIWSGLQTYHDVIQFIDEYKSGDHPFIVPDAKVDVFAYSIGAFLSEILVMTNHNNYFEHSKLVMFCGGPVLNRLTPASKLILDSEANVALYSFAIEHLNSHLKKDKKLHHHLRECPEGIIFSSMLNYGIMSDLREERLREIGERLLTITLKKDSVAPPYEAINTLQGRYRDIPTRVDIHDFPYPHTHEEPFPALKKISDEVDAGFRLVFDEIGVFLNK